jgi:hypothetical protein
LQAMANGTGRSIYVQSGFRSSQEQAALVNSKGIWSPSNPTGAAPVGSSLHESGNAADITPGREAFGGVAGRYGLSFPISAEPWHVQGGGGGGGSAPASGGGSTGASGGAAPSGPTPAQRRAARIKREKAAAGAYARDTSSAVKTQSAALKTARSWETVEARLEAIDLRVSAGKYTWMEGAIRKRAIIQKAMGWLKGNDKLRAMAYLRELDEEQRDLGESALSDAQAAYPDNPTDRPSRYDMLGGALDYVDLQVAAGERTAASGLSQKKFLLQGAINNPEGLSQEDVLRLKADLKNLDENVAATVDNTEAIKALQAELKAFNDNADRVSAVSLGAAWKALADVISGQIAGVGYTGRALTASAGNVVRY